MYRVIMIDDEPWALEGLAEIIDWEKAGFVIERRFTDPQEALDYLCGNEPDVVFTDIRMPGISGVEIISQAREKGLRCEFVLISSYEDFEAAKRAIRLNVCQYILKPYDTQEIGELAVFLRERLEVKQDDVPSFHWDDPPEETLRKAEAMRKPAGKYSNAFLCLFCEKGKTPEEILGVEWFPLSVRGVNGAFLALSNDARSARETFLRSEGPDCGVSRVHENAVEEFPVLLREAWYSLRCGFQYADKEVVGEIQFYLCENRKNELFLGSTAEKFHFSEPYFCALFKRGTGVSVMRFAQQIRIQYAAYLIRSSEKKLQEISEEVGFGNYSYFGKLFKKYLGTTPENYRGTRRGGNSTESISE